jgi:hypothetical protein
MKFKLNDPVRVIATPCRHFDQVGSVVTTGAGGFHIAGLDDAPLWFHPDELILAEVVK